MTKSKIILLTRYLILKLTLLVRKIFFLKLKKKHLIDKIFLEKKIYKNRLITNANIEILNKFYPNDFESNYLLAINYFENGKKKFVTQLNKSWEIRKKILQKKNFLKFDQGNLSKSCITGSLGNHFYLSNWLEAKRLKLNNYKNTEIILNKKDKLSNPELFEYFKNKIKLNYDHNLNDQEKKVKQLTNIPLEYAIPIKKSLTQIHIATNIINNKRIDKPFFKLSQKHKKIGNSYLKKIGLNKNDWFVTLHVREGSSKGDFKSESFRNGNIEDYYKAIKFIVNKGGYVFRVGDDSLSKLPYIKGVIDYANSKHKSQALDIFLGAKSKFCIATSSGYYIIPYLFGIPILMTNSLSSLEYWLLRKKDFFLPRTIYDKSKNKTLSLLESLNPPYSILSSDLIYFLKYFNIKILLNSSEEIYESVKEIFEEIFYKKKNNNKINDNFKRLMSKKYMNFSNEKLYPLTKIPKKFLKKNI